MSVVNYFITFANKTGCISKHVKCNTNPNPKYAVGGGILWFLALISRRQDKTREEQDPLKRDVRGIIYFLQRSLIMCDWLEARRSPEKSRMFRLKGWRMGEDGSCLRGSRLIREKTFTLSFFSPFSWSRVAWDICMWTATNINRQTHPTKPQCQSLSLPLLPQQAETIQCPAYRFCNLSFSRRLQSHQRKVNLFFLATFPRLSAV